MSKKRRKTRYPPTGPALFVIAETKDGWVFKFPDQSASEEIHETILRAGANVSRHYTRKATSGEERIPAGGLTPEQIAFLREFVTNHIAPLDPAQTVYVPDPKAVERAGIGGGLLASAKDGQFPQDLVLKMEAIDSLEPNEWRAVKADELQIRAEGGLVRGAHGELSMIIRTSPDLVFHARIEDLRSALPQLLELDGISGLVRATDTWKKGTARNGD